VSPVAIGTALAWTLVVIGGALLRSRAYAIFRGVLLGIYGLIFLGLASEWQKTPLWPAILYLHATVYLHALVLTRPRLMPLAYRALVSIPQAFFSAGTLLAFPWAIVSAIGFTPYGFFLPYLAALVGIVQSLVSREEERDVVVADGSVVPGVQRVLAGEHRSERPLRIVQITDPHIGPFMSVARLRRIVERAVKREPDLVFLTCDFLTMESQSDPTLLGQALAPLVPLAGRTFACLGNHDHEALPTVRSALDSAGVQLLIDEATVVETSAGRVQIVGMDFHFRDRKARMTRVIEAFPRVVDALRIVLLHDPGAFRHLPSGEADLVLSGHTHGGQVGLVSLGLHHTMLRMLMNAPDHGFWGCGTNRLYVHRGTGHYGFPLRLGVPAEESLLRIHAVH
jgi:predicted MPP superfamily phosphohydrolase